MRVHAWEQTPTDSLRRRPSAVGSASVEQYAVAMNPSINYPPLSHQPGLLRSAAHESVVCGTPTRFVLSAYANRIMVVVTQTNNMGTLVRRHR